MITIILDREATPRRKCHSWTVDEARRFLESARRDDDVFYPAYALVLVLGLRKGELLGLTWELVSWAPASCTSGSSFSASTASFLHWVTGLASAVDRRGTDAPDDPPPKVALSSRLSA